MRERNKERSYAPPQIMFLRFLDKDVLMESDEKATTWTSGTDNVGLFSSLWGQ